MARVNRIVEIDASENCEDVSLQECNQQLERGERDRETERQDRAKPTEEAERTQHGHEAAEHFQRNVAGKHVREQPNAMGNRPGKKRQHFDERHQGENVNRDSAWHEQLEEAQAVFPEAIYYDREKDE